MLLKLSKMKRSLCTMVWQITGNNKNDKTRFFENLAKITNLGKAKNENLKCHIFHGKHFIMGRREQASSPEPVVW